MFTWLKHVHTKISNNIIEHTLRGYKHMIYKYIHDASLRDSDHWTQFSESDSSSSDVIASEKGCGDIESSWTRARRYRDTLFQLGSHVGCHVGNAMSGIGTNSAVRPWSEHFRCRRFHHPSRSPGAPISGLDSVISEISEIFEHQDLRSHGG